jgi:hypothetical protein
MDPVHGLPYYSFTAHCVSEALIGNHLTSVATYKTLMFTLRKYKPLPIEEMNFLLVVLHGELVAVYSEISTEHVSKIC